MKYNFPPLMQTHRHLVTKMIESGSLSPCRMFINLPDDFDFGTDKPKPIARGLGDVIARVAQPIARIIDTLTAGNLSNCGGCKNRQEKLNQMFPFE